MYNAIHVSYGPQNNEIAVKELYLLKKFFIEVYMQLRNLENTGMKTNWKVQR